MQRGGNRRMIPRKLVVWELDDEVGSRPEPDTGRMRRLFRGWPGFLIHVGTFFAVSFYLELVFQLLAFGSLSGTFFYSALLFLPISGICAFVCGLFPRKGNRIATWTLVSLLCLLFAVQLIYHAVFQAFLSFSQVGIGGDVFSSFWREIARAVAANWWKLLLLFLPLPGIGLLMKVCPAFHCRRRPWALQGSLAAGCLVLYLLGIGTMPWFGTGNYSMYDLYHKTWVLDLSVNRFGVLTTARLELFHMLTGEEASDEWQHVVVPPMRTPGQNNTDPDVVPVDRSPNILDIDFEELMAQETSEAVLALHKYFAESSGTPKNEYTGMFKGYNLITICAESFSPAVISQELTPTLYRMANESFIFTNYYTSFPSNTTDGEYAFCNGIFPDLSRSKTNSSFDVSSKNSIPFVLGNQFNALGYTSRAYHNYDNTFYRRNVTHPHMGYEFKAWKKGLTFSNTWPTSDLEMVEQSLPEYIQDEPFHTYYMTFSGHMWYDFGANQMADKNREAVQALPYSNRSKAYLACNLELEYALTYLVEQLEAAGVADRTVIALASDHFPYNLSLKDYSDIMGYSVDDDFGKYKSTFLLWCPGMTETVIVDKPCCSVDILPTLSNLFGLPYDSRLMMGNDVLSTSMPIAILSNQSFITEDIMFNSRTGEVTRINDEELPEGYVDSLIAFVKNKFTISTAILKNDYYSYIIPEPAQMGNKN